MASTIPYDPSLVLGNLVDPALIENLKVISAAQRPVDVAQDTLNDTIRAKIIDDDILDFSEENPFSLTRTF
jgi:hypothetical protein